MLGGHRRRVARLRSPGMMLGGHDLRPQRAWIRRGLRRTVGNPRPLSPRVMHRQHRPRLKLPLPGLPSPASPPLRPPRSPPSPRSVISPSALAHLGSPVPVRRFGAPGPRSALRHLMLPVHGCGRIGPSTTANSHHGRGLRTSPGMRGHRARPHSNQTRLTQHQPGAKPSWIGARIVPACTHPSTPTPDLMLTENGAADGRPASLGRPIPVSRPVRPAGPGTPPSVRPRSPGHPPPRASPAGGRDAA